MDIRRRNVEIHDAVDIFVQVVEQNEVESFVLGMEYVLLGWGFDKDCRDIRNVYMGTEWSFADANSRN